MNKVSTLVSVRWLAERLSSGVGNLRILDASWHLPNANRNAAEEYKKQHIEGALYFDIDECSDKTSPYSHMLPSIENFAEYVGNLGVSNDSHVVVYDNNDKFGLFSAPRVWWMFRTFGHQAVSLLNGGLPKWLDAGYPVTDAKPKVARAKFNASFNPSAVKSFEEIDNNITDKQFAVVDARAAGRFDGIDPEPRPDCKPGHIPGSINIPFPTILNKETREVKPVEDLSKIFKDKGIDINKPVTATCGSGVSACCLILAAHLCGNDEMDLFDGAWVEYFHRAKPENIRVKK
ncbi:3-mercaptopyruvate sulfurtransferase-like [Ptychodera flava]|uniref:3-mercaptopyruvate sulfurtransferase-like n=1 Tax=Ptychodera flava TaxID=63121 RepID=UPI00396A4E02